MKYATREAIDQIGVVSQSEFVAITNRDIRKFCAGVGDSNPLYLDRDIALAAGLRGPIAPALLLPFLTTTIPLASDLKSDGTRAESSIGLASVPSQTFAGENQFAIHDVAHAGEEICSRSRVADIQEKVGRSGALVIQSNESEIWTRDGRLIQSMRNTIIVRPLEGLTNAEPRDSRGKAAVRPPGSPVLGIPAGSVRVGDSLPTVTHCPGVVEQFMFGGAIWALHRNHYDREFARSLGLRDALVYGPLQAAYLHKLVVDWVGDPRQVESLSFRHVGQAYVGDALHCAGIVTSRRELDGLSKVGCDLWADRSDGTRTTTAAAMVSVASTGSP